MTGYDRYDCLSLLPLACLDLLLDLPFLVFAVNLLIWIQACVRFMKIFYLIMPYEGRYVFDFFLLV